MTPRGSLLIAGATSDAGKSVLVAGICRLLARRGVRVAPFKAQNMSNNSVVTLDGGEIGRAQALQARACGLEPSVRFNPILLKPGSDRRSQLVVRGRAIDTVGARDYFRHRTALRAVVADELAALRKEFDVVICEGAGSPAEINLRATDLANMGLARAADLPVLVVGDIDRGGVLAHLFGTLAVLEPADQRLVAGFVVNKFRGDVELLRPGLDQLTALTGRPTLGVLPFCDDLWLDAEDSLGTVANAPVGRPAPPVGREWLTVAAIRLPRISNSTDVEALACEPGVAVRWVCEPSRLVDADLVVLPGSKATVDDLNWLRHNGIADALCARAAAGRPILGICGGFQMLGRRIVDGVESGAGEVPGLGLLDLDIEFGATKILRHTTVSGAGQRDSRTRDPVPGTGGAAGEPGSRVGMDGLAAATADRVSSTTVSGSDPSGSASGMTDNAVGPTGIVTGTTGIAASGYEIHHGRVVRSAESAWLAVTGYTDADAYSADRPAETGGGDLAGTACGCAETTVTTAGARDGMGAPVRSGGTVEPEGAVRGAIWGTHLHGLLESDAFRRAWLTEVARHAGRTGFTVAPQTSVTAVRAAQLDLLADLVADHLDIALLERLISRGAPPDLPVVTAQLS